MILKMTVALKKTDMKILASVKDIPKILETPYVGEDKKNKKPPYKLEIEMLKQQHFDPELKNKVMQQ